MAEERGVARRVRAPKQLRSEETLERIVYAAECLYRSRGVDEVSVRDICGLADASPSSFYARFSDRDALLLVVFDRFRERVLRLHGAISEEWPAGRPFPDFVEFVLARFTGLFRDEARLVETFRAREDHLPELQRRRQALGEDILRGCLSIGRARYAEVDWDHVEAKLDGGGMAIVTAAFRGAASPPEQLGFRVDDAPNSIVKALAKLVLDFVPHVGA